MINFDRCKPAIFAEFQESISEGVFCITECWLLQLEGSRARKTPHAKNLTRLSCLQNSPDTTGSQFAERAR
jgi:hypothetical protein